MSIGSTLRQLYRSLPWARKAEAIWLETRAARQSANEQLIRSLLTDPRRQVPGSLARFEHQVFSQGGEDGVLREIFRRIGEGTRSFVEFGVEDGIQNNTHFLLHQGWRGCWLEGSPTAVEAIRNQFAPSLATGQLKVKHTFITAENIADSFRELQVPTEVDLLSIDIDGNDYWVWKALAAWRPRVVVLEYNANYPADCDWVMPYDPQHSWGVDTYFGASLLAYTRLGQELGYRLVGCALNGTNAFFVRADLAGDHFTAEATAAFHFEPARFFLIERRGHNPSVRLSAAALRPPA